MLQLILKPKFMFLLPLYIFLSLYLLGAQPHLLISARFSFVQSKQLCVMLTPLLTGNVSSIPLSFRATSEEGYNEVAAHTWFHI